MLFNSIEFAIFLPIVFILYWFVTNRNLKLQNILLVLASYVFYGWWDWRFLSLIIFSSSIDYFVGIGLGKTNEQRKRKLLLLTSVFINIGLLWFFKYFNFFAESFANAFTLLGNPINSSRLNIILPVGISFYTFQTLSYSIDLYKRKIEPTKDIVSFFAFVSFFPQLVAGPIERATNFLPQFYKKRVFEYDTALSGFTQILWGLFKKMVIADNCALIVNQIFSDYHQYSGSTLLLGAVLFAFQIYGDFSGYSDIAIGCAKLFGFKLKRNFAYPYFSRDIAEFWRRWHISLTTWFRDYVYIPLGGSHGSMWIKIRNIFIVFLVSGFWHGANWTFITWGFINACCFLPLLLVKRNRTNIDIIAHDRLFPSIKEVFQMSVTFSIVVLGWIFFRSENVMSAIEYITIIFSKSLFSIPYAFGVGTSKAVLTISSIIILIAIEWFGRKKETPISIDNVNGKLVQWGICFVMAIVIFLFMEQQQSFIYFQF